MRNIILDFILGIVLIEVVVIKEMWEKLNDLQIKIYQMKTGGLNV